MGSKKYLIISVVLGGCAICLDSFATAYYSQSTVVRAKALVSQGDMEEAKADSHELVRKGGVFKILGLCVAVLAVVFWVFSGFWRGKRLWQWIPLLLVVVYLLLQLMMV